MDLPDMLLSELKMSATHSIEESESNVTPCLDRVARGSPCCRFLLSGSLFHFCHTLQIRTSIISLYQITF